MIISYPDEYFETMKASLLFNDDEEHIVRGKSPCGPHSIHSRWIFVHHLLLNDSLAQFVVLADVPKYYTSGVCFIMKMQLKGKINLYTVQHIDLTNPSMEDLF